MQKTYKINTKSLENVHFLQGDNYEQESLCNIRNRIISNYDCVWFNHHNQIGIIEQLYILCHDWILCFQDCICSM